MATNTSRDKSVSIPYDEFKTGIHIEVLWACLADALKDNTDMRNISCALRYVYVHDVHGPTANKTVN